jgi:hypothetical protein
MALLEQLSMTTLACLEEMIARRLLDDDTVLPDDGARRSSALYELSKLRTGSSESRADGKAKRPRKLITAKPPQGLRPPHLSVAVGEALKAKSAR